jgi:hypothetical protein
MYSIGAYWISPWRLAHLKACKLPVFVHVGAQDILINPDNSRYIARNLGASIQVYDTAYGCLFLPLHEFHSTYLSACSRAFFSDDVQI